MDPLTEFINTLYKLIIGIIPENEDTLIKMHTRCLEKLGDVSLPLSCKVWSYLIRKTNGNELESNNIVYQLALASSNTDASLDLFKESLSSLKAQIKTHKCIKACAHLFLDRPPLFSYGIRTALTDADHFGTIKVFSQPIQLTTNQLGSDSERADLTTLRLSILKATVENLLRLTVVPELASNLNITLAHNVETSNPSILCGPVLNEQGVKDTQHTASDFFRKRIIDMRLIAQHRYRVNIRSAEEWEELFTQLGKASVTIELLANKPHKSIKVTLDNLCTSNKGSSFIFYNCARLSILLKEFYQKVQQGIYPELPELNQVDFSLLKQPEEWELLYVYILQYPHVVQSCIRGVEQGNVNPQHLIRFLSNLSSLFSTYYRRVRILVAPRDHLFAGIHTRIYLLKALQIVFHNALRILNIAPVKEM